MSTISWYETTEGKLAMCLAGLLLVLAILMGRTDVRLQPDPRSETKSAESAQVFEEQRANNLAELPPLSPIDMPKPAISPSEGQVVAPKEEPLRPQEKPSTDQTPPETPKPKKHSSFFTFWLP